jgi:hypothetical protein
MNSAPLPHPPAGNTLATSYHAKRQNLGEGDMAHSSSMVAKPPPAPLWPVFIAPLVAGVYYLSIKSAFAQSIVSVLGRTATTDIDLSDIYSPQWGAHWVYRLAAEILSASFGTFVAAGLAHGRELAAAIAGGVTISFGFLLRIGALLYIWMYMEPGEFSVPEPWYQYAIEGLMIIVPPVIGVYVAEAAHDMHRQTPHGFGGINRLHFVWLWLPAFWYALGLITPMARLYALGPESSGPIATAIIFIINFIPAAAMAVPLYLGLALLAGQLGTALHAVGRNLLGVIVLALGFVAGLAIQSGWYWLFQKIGEALFG